MTTSRTTRSQQGGGAQPIDGARSSSVGGHGETCTRIQLDLSAMLDGELDPPGIRRVLLHVDSCPSCGGFLEGIRMQLQAHRELASIGELSGGELSVGLGADRGTAGHASSVLAKNFGLNGEAGELAAAVRRELERNRDRLVRVLYELGRGYVLLGESPNFSRDVGREPMSIADMCLRGRLLIDEAERSSAQGGGPEWIRAKNLFASGDVRSPAENMARGKRLLSEALSLSPDFHEARIYLGHAFHVCEERSLAKNEFRAVLDVSTDPVMRAFALENLGNVYLEEGRPAASIPYFQELVDSGVLATQPRFFTTFFNLALAYGLLLKFAECERCLARLYEDYPHKRRHLTMPDEPLIRLAQRRMRPRALLDEFPDARGV